MTKLEKIEQQEQKAREKIAAMQNELRQIGEQRTEQENLQIIQQIRALKMPREEFYTFINTGELPATLAGTADGAGQTETIYTRRGRRETTAEATGGEPGTQNFESEDMNHEEQ